ncbi:MAG: hypothetical protein AAFR56_05355, partial [Chloroflexota bacterium]
MLKSLARLTLLLVATLALLIITVPLRYNALVNPPYPFLLFTYRECATPCWLGVQPGTTSRAEVIRTYERAGIPYQVVTNQVSGRGLWTAEAVHGFHGAIFLDGDNIAAEIFMARYESCALDFVETFGEPDVVTQGRWVSLFYYDYRMVISAPTDNAPPRTGVRLMTTSEELQRRITPDAVVPWPSVQG